jgi:hypothetical protein
MVYTTPIPDEQRRQWLQHYLAQDIAVTRGRIESVTPYTAVVVYGQPVNHACTYSPPCSCAGCGYRSG